MRQGLHPIVEVPVDANEVEESRGTKARFWFTEPPPLRRRGLFKVRKRSDSGEDWAEKLACELARVLCVPCAEYDLATWNGQPGVVSWNVVEEGTGEELVEGNQILAGLHPEHALAPTPQEERRQRTHTPRRVLEACSLVGLPRACPSDEALQTGADAMVGYLLLDAWIGNTDRHHRNWAWLIRPHGALTEFEAAPERDELERQSRWQWDFGSGTLKEAAVLAPSFDHGASLSHGLTDAEREGRLETHDRGYSIDSWAVHAKSKFWSEDPSPRRLHPVEAYAAAADLLPAAAAYWRARLAAVSDAAVEDCLARMPVERMSATASQFCRRLLTVNKDRVLSLPR